MVLHDLPVPRIRLPKSAARILNRTQASKAEVQDAKTRLKRFPQNLGSNFLAVFGKDNLKAFVVGVAATELSTAADDAVHGHFKDRNHSTAFANVGETIGQAYVMAPAVCGLLLAGHYSRNDRFHSFTYALAQGYAINAGLASAMKSASQRATAGRKRPSGIPVHARRQPVHDRGRHRKLLWEKSGNPRIRHRELCGDFADGQRCALDE